jgi:hypothetical protein
MTLDAPTFGHGLEGSRGSSQYHEQPEREQSGAGEKGASALDEDTGDDLPLDARPTPCSKVKNTSGMPSGMWARKRLFST